ncbi:MAG TPA: hypothetical protein VL688_00025 [Verrucomicrobiae bacterium]|jgi:hypothetical protein|nr:hypothetical protein [Verrucomicrobiae bacterium]
MKKFMIVMVLGLLAFQAAASAAELTDGKVLPVKESETALVNSGTDVQSDLNATSEGLTGEAQAVADKASDAAAKEATM